MSFREKNSGARFDVGDYVDANLFDINRACSTSVGSLAKH